MILITGSTGFIGRHLVSYLMERQIPIRCYLPEYKLKRIPWDMDSPHAPELVVGTILDEEAIFQAVTGVHTIIHLENALWWGRQRDMERIEISGTQNLISAARSARVGRIVTLSQLGAAASSAYTLHRIKGMTEAIIRDSGLAYTIIRTGLVYGEDDAFINNIAMMLIVNPFFFLQPGHGEVVLHPIYIDDLVKVLFLSLEHAGVLDHVVEVGGPEYTTLSDLMLTVMRVSGIYRWIIPVPPYLMRWIIWIYSRIFSRSLMTSQWLDILATNRTARLGNTFEYFRFHPRRFEDTLLTYIPKQRFILSLLRFSIRRRPRGV